MEVEFVFLKDPLKVGLKNPVLITGFPGAGLVGSIATTFLTMGNGFELIGYGKSDGFAPIAAIHDYRPLPPLRVLASKQMNAVVVLSEMTIPVSLNSLIAEKILELADKIKAGMVVSLGGITLGEKEDVVYFIASTPSMAKLALSKKVGEPIKEGATTGVTGVLLYSSYIKEIDAIALLAEANPDLSDPKASSNVLKALQKLLGVEIDTKALDKEAKEIAEALKEKIVKSKVPVKSSMYG